MLQPPSCYLPAALEEFPTTYLLERLRMVTKLYQSLVKKGHNVNAQLHQLQTVDVSKLRYCYPSLIDLPVQRSTGRARRRNKPKTSFVIDPSLLRFGTACLCRQLHDLTSPVFDAAYFDYWIPAFHEMIWGHPSVN